VILEIVWFFGLGRRPLNVGHASCNPAWVLLSMAPGGMGWSNTSKFEKEGNGMPIFEYQCKQCGHCFEHLVLNENEPDRACPTCGAEKAEKLMSCVNALGGGKSGFCSPASSSRFS
jgi:putative FmdB family regulatory protein